MNSAYRKIQRWNDIKESAARIFCSVCFCFLFALCFFPFFL